MTNQYRSCYTSNTARYRCNSIYDRLYCCVINITAEFTFCIYVDTYIDDCLTFFYIFGTNNTGAACCYNNDICFTCYRRHIYSSCVAD